MTIDEQIEILRAQKDGYTIEARRRDDQEHGWHKWTSRCDFNHFEYRIVPKPRRFVIFKWKTAVYAVPYGSHIPDDAKIICTATEDENLKMVDVAKWAADEAKKLVERKHEQ